MGRSIAEFSQQLTEAGLFADVDLRAMLDALPAGERPQDGEQFARWLVRLKRLTAYQAQQVYSGKAGSLVYGNYLVLDKLGQGGMGVVLKARHRRMDRLVALKILSPHITTNPHSIARFQREVRAAAKLNHPNIVHAYDADEAHGTHFLVMEFVDGNDLSALVKQKGPLSVEKAVPCVLQAAQGLTYAHGWGVVHRDIKPSNLLIDREGTVKLLDLGLARVESAEEADNDELTGSGAIVGTVDYMAPEQARDVKSADARVDIYSLGATLWYLLIGRAMYPGDSPIAKLMAHQNEPIPSLRATRSDIAPELDAIFAKMVAKRPGDRYARMAEVIDALEHYQEAGASSPSIVLAPAEESRLSQFFDQFETDDGQTGKSSAASLRSRSATRRGPLQNRKRPLLAAAAVGLLALIAASAYWLGRPDDPAPRAPARANSPPIVDPEVATAAVVHSELETDPLRTDEPVVEPANEPAVALPIETMPVESPVAVAAVPVGDPAVIAESPGAPVETAAPATEPVAPVANGWYGWPEDAPPPAIAPFTAAQAIKHQQAWASYLQVPVEFQNEMGIRFRLIPPGEFLMGSPAEFREPEKAKFDWYTQACLGSEVPQHRVIVTQPYFVSISEVTQSQYQSMSLANPSYYSHTGEGKSRLKVSDANELPVEMVTPALIETFLQQLNQYQDVWGAASPSASPELQNARYRLLTEAEWEFACRGGSEHSFSFGAKPTALARAGWYKLNSESVTHPVGLLDPNPFGLYDVHGNVAEFVSDGFSFTDYEQRLASPAVDPVNRIAPDGRVSFRGGCAQDTETLCRSAQRYGQPPNDPRSSIGFRIAISVDSIKASIHSIAAHDARIALDNRLRSPALAEALRAFHTADRTRITGLIATMRRPQNRDLELLRMIAHLGALLDPPKPVMLPSMRRSVKRVKLADLEFESATVGWGQPLRNRVLANAGSNPLLMVDGQFIESGLYAHAASEYAVRLDAKWTALRTDYGIYGTYNAGEVVFVILGDGNELFRSARIRDHVLRSIEVDVRNVDRLQLIVENGADGANNDWSVWLNPELSR